ncbi:hypothetical protein SNA_01725 [Streptomyces natalensis ATCC 27448]|uniref:Uncharacterized protein n=1 Tax=Streptomyces natalensis ATCC 27448 TaxID=1240678 RepID=A0A0D7CST2_9ACTN|nr:hypothetical protein SNA_01725 [Streptomyces natalensis ATCC 27448]
MRRTPIWIHHIQQDPHVFSQRHHGQVGVAVQSFGEFLHRQGDILISAGMGTSPHDRHQHRRVSPQLHS